MQIDSLAPVQGWVQLNTGTHAGFDYISLVGRDTIYVSGDVLLRSTDAGTTWQTLLNTPVPNGWLKFVDDSVGFLCVSSDTVYRTLNGGESWQSAPTKLPGGKVLFFVFASRDSGWVGYGNSISRTTDGGATWSGQLPLAATNLRTLAFFDSRHGFAMGSVEYWGHGKSDAAVFESTTDGGTTWTAQYPILRGGVNGLDKTVYGVTALDTNTLIAAVRWDIARSTDAGDTWDTLSYPGIDYYNGFFAVSFSDKLHGAAVGTSGWIIQTSDGGKTWTRTQSNVLGNLNAIAFVDSALGYACGASGVVLKTADAGQGIVNKPPLESSSSGIQVFPEPASKYTSVNYRLQQAEAVTIEVHDVSGTILRLVPIGTQEPGLHTARIDISSMPNGIYTVIIRGDKISEMAKFEVLH